MTLLRALACDDEALLCDSMARREEKLGLQVDKAQDGQAGLALIGINEHDLIVTDTYELGRGSAFTLRLPVRSQTAMPTKA